MTHVKQWMADLALLPNFDISRLKPCQLSLTQYTLSYPELIVYLTNIGEVTGWLQQSGCVQRLQDQIISPENRLIMGEFCQKNKHWCVEYIGSQQWQLYEFTCQASGADHATHVAEEICHNLVNSKDYQQLKYWRFWEKISESNPAPVVRVAVFVGFVESK